MSETLPFAYLRPLADPDHLPAQAVQAMNSADLILLPRKGDAKSDLIDLRRAICARVLTGPTRIVAFDMPVRAAGGDYAHAVDDWHDAIAAAWRAQIVALDWGDPALYDSSLRIAERLRASGLPRRVRVVPGLTSLQLLTAAHAIPLNALAGAVTITTGRLLRACGWPKAADTVVVMLDSGCAFEVLEPEGISIWWGAYVGMPQETLIHGPLATVAPRIAAARANLRARPARLLDVCLLRKNRADVA